MTHLPHPGLMISVPLVLGVLGIWFAYRFRAPLALVLLLLGYGLQASTHFVTTELYQSQLAGLALGLALVFYEGGRRMGAMQLAGDTSLVGHIVALGAKISWLFMAFAAHFVTGTSMEISLLIAALLLIMAPYSVDGMVKFLRGEERWTRILSWETQSLSCLAAGWAVLVGTGILANQAGEPSIVEILKVTLWVTGVGVGIGGVAFFLAHHVRDGMHPDLQEPLQLGIVLLACALAQVTAFGSGIVAASTLGYLEGRHPERQSDLGKGLNIVILALVGINTGAILTFHDVVGQWLRDIPFALLVAFVLRPFLVWLAAGRKKAVAPRTLRAMELIAPRGIITLAVTASVAEGLERLHHPEAHRLVPIVVWVVVVTQLVPYVLAFRVGPEEASLE